MSKKKNDSFIIKDDNEHDEIYENDHEVNSNNTITGLQSNLTSAVRSEALKVLAQNRGLRLRVIRQITNTNLEVFAQMVGIESGSLGRIERGTTCLSILRAKFICDRLMNYNLFLNPIWLLSGKGVSIKKITLESIDILQCLKETINGNNEHELGHDSMEFLSMSTFFKQVYNSKKPTTMFMNDNYMEPLYKKGDLLCATEVVERDYQSLHHVPCIITLQNNTILVRYVFYESKNTLILLSIKHSKPHIININDIKSISKIQLVQSTDNSQYSIKENSENQENISKIEHFINI